MAFKFFNWFSKNDEKEFDEQINNNLESFAKPDNQDGAIESERRAGQDSYFATYGGLNAHSLNIQNDPRTIVQLINSYRNVSQLPEVDNAIDEIVKDAIVQEDYTAMVKLNLDDTDFSEAIQKRINEEFEIILSLYNFNKRGHKLFRKWYVDSRIYFHKIINPKAPSEGIQELRLLNPKKMTFNREIIKKTENNVDIVIGYEDWFTYQDANDDVCTSCTTGTSINTLKIPASSIVYATSGLTDACDNIIGYLHRAIRLANMLNMLEDALAVYRIVRAPERRVFYIDTGNMPPKQAQQHLQHVMNNTKNKIVYNSNTGKVSNQFNNMSIAEDYFLTRKEGASKTEIETLSGAANLGEVGDLEWLNKKLYEALRIPLSRIPKEGSVVFGGGSEITRDELSFSKFIRMIQTEFSEIFTNPLGTNLLLKNIITKDEWQANYNKIKVIYASDSYYEELKELSIGEQRLNQLNLYDPYIGRYFSNTYVLKKLFKMSDEEIMEQQDEIKDEKSKDLFKRLDEFGDENPNSNNFDNNQNDDEDENKSSNNKDQKNKIINKTIDDNKNDSIKIKTDIEED